MTKLPPLTKVRDLGGDEFEKLMHQLLIAYADKHRFEYEPHGKSGAADSGIDGLARQGGVPGLKGPVAFQFKWLAGNLSKGDNARQITKSISDASNAGLEFRHYVLVSPENSTPAQKKWLLSLCPGGKFKIHHWGHERIAALFRLSPGLLASCYPQPPPPQASGAFDPQTLAPYLGHLIDNCRFVPMRGVRRDDRRERGDPQRMADDPDQRLELERIFVELDTTTQVKKEESDQDRLELARRMARRRGQDRGEPKLRFLPALEAVAADFSRHAVLHGAPGCGKSTFVRFLVLALSHCGLGRKKDWLPRLPGWPADEATLLPIRIELRHFAAWLQAQKITTAEPCHLWDHFTQGLAELQARKSWLELLPSVSQAARAGRAIFLLDGLDEVPGGKGKLFVRDCIDQFASGEIGKSCRIIVTCRTRSYDADYKGRKLHLFEPDPAGARKPKPEDGTRPKDAKLTAAEAGQATAFELAPFDDSKKKRFVEAWYKALVELGEVEPAESGPRVEALEAAVCDPRNERLSELARNPLLLTVIAHLHSSQRDLKLPDNRAELFHDLIDLLLTRWAERHQRRSEASAADGTGETLGELLLDPGVRGFELEHLLQLVAELAHDHYRGGQEQSLILIPAETLRRKLAEQHHDPDLELGAAWAERVMNFIQFRAGLLNSPDGENYDFPHSLLGEYLAAYHLARQRRSSEVIASKVTADGNWDEVVRLAAGHHVFVRKETRDALDLVEELCQPASVKTASDVTDLEWRRVALAGDILHEMGPQRLERERRQGPADREAVRRLLQCLLQRGALPVRDRARAGTILGGLGDHRPGVGVKNGVPDIDWIEIPVGPFKMGEGKEEHVCNVITKPYRISRYPITVAQYQAFVDAGGYGEKRFWTEAGWKWKLSEKRAGPDDYDPVFQTPNHPRVGVTWYEAVAFCRWLNELLRDRVALPSVPQPEAERQLGPTRVTVTLPSEAEWERAARHTDGRKFPWNPQDKSDPASRCNCRETEIRHTTAVGLFPSGVAMCQAHDMAGNVWEWTRSLWGKDYNLDFPYPYRTDDKREDLDAANNVARVLRGGSWDDDADLARCAYRLGDRPDYRFSLVGFRVVASPFVSGV
ncbi:MAG: SUMF1/EgtB/PvdO family nonheme iron enzyme [Verrucomicrobia bacterium]|nr:SUMF1/EgtB/PvdO family nonheme iron enzyme [Verrucomicrobiota bacterium]